jgi:hypothetical protein
VILNRIHRLYCIASTIVRAFTVETTSPRVLVIRYNKVDGRAAEEPRFLVGWMSNTSWLEGASVVIYSNKEG